MYKTEWKIRILMLRCKEVKVWEKGSCSFVVLSTSCRIPSLSRSRQESGTININLFTNRARGCTGEYWPKVVAAWIDHREVRTRTTEGQYFQQRLEQARRESILNVLASAIKNSRLVTVILETVRMAKSPPSKNQSERPIYIYHIMIFLSFPWLGNPPRDVKATPNNDTSIILSWNAPLGHSQGVVSYNNFFGSQIGA